ncbi:phospholipase A2 inhibitor and Ly6/PLAUR domain-containing protein-like [Archocentrus centrarchus]|uniref:phospholipase A2 inhibitor and Ly6/PLAUR domain-containing protein-like n=1 Tax=Archocentrus centrarchus TaxID=63155 RepID=UPI0011EA0F78|nr:phospholipase A2 inhibitor and Ly6/PLAUR domain-containing protein-like [Archocentrus centrarchus]
MKPILPLILLWAVSSTAGALQCQTCTDQMCSSTAPNNCSPETMCVMTTILAYSLGTWARQIYQACASSSLCPFNGTQIFSVDLGVQSALASAMCCNTDNCNTETLPDPAPQSGNGLLCNVCDPSTSQCTSTLQCEGVENRCFQSTSESLCSAAGRLKLQLTESGCMLEQPTVTLTVVAWGQLAWTVAWRLLQWLKTEVVAQNPKTQRPEEQLSLKVERSANTGCAASSEKWKP